MLAQLAPQNPALADDNCRAPEDIKPNFERRNIGANCGNSVACQAALRSQVTYSDRVVAAIQQACVPQNQQPDIAVSGQKEAIDKELSVVRSAEDRTERLISLLDEAYNQHKQKIIPLANDFQPAGLRKTLESPDAARSLGVPRGPKTLAEAKKPETFAANNGADFLHQIGVERERRKAMLETLQQNEQKLVDRKKKSGTTPDSSGSGFSPMDMLPLASSAAGMAGMMKKTPSAGDGKITDGDPLGSLKATAPTPDSPNTSKVSQAEQTKLSSPPATGLGSSKQAPQPNGTAPPASPATDLPGSSLGGGGEAAASGGEITSRKPGPAMAAARSNTSGASSSFGAGGAGSPAGNAESAHDESAAKEEDATGGGPMGGGFGGLGGRGGGLGSSSENHSNPDGSPDAIKDIYDGMKNAAEESPGEAASSGVQGEESEDLFLRVRACVTRNLRKGKVHNGLGEQVEE